MYTSPGSGAPTDPSPIIRISTRVDSCIVPTNTGSPPSPCAISAPSAAA